MGAIGCAVALGLCAGLLAMGAVAVGTARKGTRVGCYLVAGFCGFVGGALGLSTVAVLVSVAVGALVVNSWASALKRRFARLVAEAPAIKDYGLRHFKALDKDGDGILTLQDLAAASDDLELGATELQILSFMFSHLRLIGHVIDTNVVSTVAAFGTPVEQVVEVYGIDRDDLESYPERIKATYHEAFGKTRR